MNKIVLAGASALAMVVAAAPASAATIIDFENQTNGAKANGYTIGGVTFNDTIGADLQVDSGVPELNGRGLAIFGDDASALEMIFAQTSINLSLAFGNDDASFTVAGDVALLRLFLGDTQVGQTTVVMNRNDSADQRIGLNGIAFNRATFMFADAALNAKNLIEAVDDIQFDTAAAAVPEPATWAMMLAGFGMVGAGLRTRRRTAVTYA